MPPSLPALPALRSRASQPLQVIRILWVVLCLALLVVAGRTGWRMATGNTMVYAAALPSSQSSTSAVPAGSARTSRTMSRKDARATSIPAARSFQFSLVPEVYSSLLFLDCPELHRCCGARQLRQRFAYGGNAQPAISGMDSRHLSVSAGCSRRFSRSALHLARSNQRLDGANLRLKNYHSSGLVRLHDIGTVVDRGDLAGISAQHPHGMNGRTSEDQVQDQVKWRRNDGSGSNANVVHEQETGNGEDRDLIAAMDTTFAAFVDADTRLHELYSPADTTYERPAVLAAPQSFGARRGGGDLGS
ncbi:hypothetical protein MSAN_02255600 [Mycena sanguinolenta]|uniref:Uncharacterized protein n=1 Tax=Mycena sanguinolenta TaxID=230812 RepID=A0A8H6XAQ9_9AGAR|nr:hypothetical protein MSAN_02255600 [Mycena sanguinolenta]